MPNENIVETVTERVNGKVVTFVRRQQFPALSGPWSAYEGHTVHPFGWIGTAATLDAIRAHVSRTYR